MGQDRVELAEICAHASNVKSLHCPASMIHCGVECSAWGRHDHLGHQGIELRRRSPTGIAAAIDAHAWTRRFPVAGDCSCSGCYDPGLQCPSSWFADGALIAHVQRLERFAHGDTKLGLY